MIKSKKRIKIVVIRSAVNFIIIIGSVFLITAFGPFVRYEIVYRLRLLKGDTFVVNTNATTQQTQQNLEGLLGPSTIDLKPTSVQFGIVIPKLDINEKVIDNVNPNDDTDITTALKEGVGHASGTAYPDQQGNVYLFAHSSADFWEIPIYNSVFTLLRELQSGDLVVVFYQGRRYNYVVYSSVVLPQNNTEYLTSKADQPTLTLQTCDPPGLDINRLYVRAHLVSIEN